MDIRTLIQQDLPHIEGWCSVEKALYMIDLVENNNVKSFIELGVFGGRSLLPVALAIKNGESNDSSIIGVDAWNVSESLEGTNDINNALWWEKCDHNKMYEYTINLMIKYGLSNDVTLVRMSSIEYASNVLDSSIDMLHQDSNHSEEISCLEVELYNMKLKSGGLWIFDDTDWETTKLAQKSLEQKNYVCIHDAKSWKVYKKL